LGKQSVGGAKCCVTIVKKEKDMADEVLLANSADHLESIDKKEEPAPLMLSFDFKVEE